MISDSDKEVFLDYIRGGMDRASAAHATNPDYTSGMFRYMTTPGCPTYDKQFADDYIAALEEGSEKRQEIILNERNIDFTVGHPRTVTVQGFTKGAYLTKGQLEAFLEFVKEGIPMASAARMVEPQTSLTQINIRANKDAEFARALKEAREVGYPVFQERIRGEIVRQAENGEYRATRDLAMIHLPEWVVLRDRRTEITGANGEAIKIMAMRQFENLPPEVIEQLIEALDKKSGGDDDQRQLAA